MTEIPDTENSTRPSAVRPTRIAIVGAGLSGMATATQLKRLADRHGLPLQCQVFEASDRLGGVIGTEIVDVPGKGRFVLDQGADMFTTQPSAALELCRAMGVEDRLLKPATLGRGAMIARGNRLIPIPEGFVLMRPTKIGSMIRTPLLSWRGKLRLLAEQFVRSRPPSVTDESVGSFVRRRLGKECLDRLVAPLVAGIYTADIERLSMATTMQPIWQMEAQHGSLMAATWNRRRRGQDRTETVSSGARYENFRAFPDGMAEFFDAMADYIGRDQIRFGHRVETAVCTADRKVRLLPDGRVFDRLVLALSASASAAILSSLEVESLPGQSTVPRDQLIRQAGRDVAEQLDQIPMASTAIVVMAVRRDRLTRLPETFGFVVPPREGRAVLAGSFASEKFAGRAPADHVIIRAFVGGILQPEILQRTDEELVQIVRAELADWIGMDRNSPIDQIAPVVRVVRWDRAMPQYEVGHLQRATAVEQLMRSVPGVELAGNALRGVGIAPLVAAAERRAERLLNIKFG